MGALIYSMGISLDGYIAGPDGSFDWGAPDEEQHRFHNLQTAELGAHVLGRKLFETMTYWDTIDEDGSGDEVEREFAGIWKRLPKVVFSRTLESTGPNAELSSDDLSNTIDRLRAETDKDIGIGGAGIAATAAELDLIDEYRPFVYPVLTGGGTPFIPPLGRQLDLELLETRAFGPVTYLRYRRVRRAN